MPIKNRTPRIKGTASQHNQLGVSFYESGAIDLAIEEFRRATKRVPWVATYWLNLGAALLDQAEDEEAESALMRALRLNPNQSVYYHLAQLHKKRVISLRREPRTTRSLNLARTRTSPNVLENIWRVGGHASLRPSTPTELRERGIDMGFLECNFLECSSFNFSELRIRSDNCI